MSEEAEKVLVIGSGIAGLTAAIYTARANLRPLVLEGDEPGGQLSLTSEVENYPGFVEGINGFDLVQNMRQQAERFGARYEGGRVERIEPGSPQQVVLDDGRTIRAHTVIIATGATARWPGLPREREYIGHGVSTCATCDGAFYRGLKVAVIGGGDSALEEALFLTRFATEVHLIHRRDTLRASKIMQRRAFDEPKIKFHWNTAISGFVGEPEEGLKGLRLKDVATGAEEQLDIDGLFIAIGHVPNTQFVRGVLDLDDQGYLKEGVVTHVAGIFAAGDVRDHVYRQAVTAAGMGCQAALEAERWLGASGLG